LSSISSGYPIPSKVKTTPRKATKNKYGYKNAGFSVKQVSLAGVASDGKIAAVKDASGKELTTPSLSDDNYTFSSNNTFELMDKAAAFSVVVNVSHHGTEQHDPLTVKTKIYEGGKLVYEDEGTATSTKSYMLSKSF
jgi:hypothetical protein